MRATVSNAGARSTPRGSFGLAGLALVAAACTAVRAPAAHEAPASHEVVNVSRVASLEAGSPSLAAAVSEPAVAVRCAHVADSSVSRYGSTATVLADGRVLLVGSTTHDAAGPYSPVVEAFDPSTHAVTKLAPLTVGRAKHAAALLADGRLLVVGGMSDEPKTSFSRSGELFDPAANRWTAVPSVPEGAIGQALVTLGDGRAVLAGGDLMYKSQKLTRVLAFDPRTLRWEKWPDAPVARAGTLLPLGDGRLLFAGDTSTWSGEESTSVDILDPATRTWSSARSSLDGMSVHQAVRVSAGEVALFGPRATDGGSNAGAVLVDDRLAHVRELAPPPDVTSTGIAAAGILYVIAKPRLLRWDARSRAWVAVATIEADDCATSVTLPARQGGRARLLLAGRCGIPSAGTMGALELCEL